MLCCALGVSLRVFVDRTVDRIANKCELNCLQRLGFDSENGERERGSADLNGKFNSNFEAALKTKRVEGFTIERF